MSKPLVSFIIVNWNGNTVIGPCLESLRRQTYRNFEIIVVDNASKDGSDTKVAELYPDVHLIRLNENRGFTGGNIAGYDDSRGDYIALINNDTVLTEAWCEVMIEALDSCPSIGFCSSKLVVSGTNIIDSAGDVFTTAFNGTKRGEGEDESFHSEPCFVPGACAAASIYKRKMLDEIGFLDDDFYFNHEDTDLNLRAWLAGWKCQYVPNAIVYHKVSASIGALSDTAVYFFSRNNEWVLIKNVPIKYLICNLPQRILYECASFGYFCVVKGKWRPFLKGKLDALIGLPGMLRKRIEVQKRVRLSDAEITRSLVPVLDYLKNRLRLGTTCPDCLRKKPESL